MLIVYGIVLVLLLTPVAAIAIAWRLMVWMPGKSHRRALPPLMDEETAVEADLRRDLHILASDIGERNVSHKYEELAASADFIEQSLNEAGYEVRRQAFIAKGKEVWNLDVERRGDTRPDEILVVGAHYDTVPGSPGANDNGTAVVANLALARAFSNGTLDRTLRFVFFPNEEAPYYMTDEMGSLQYARQCSAKGETIVGMICLETIGCFFDEPGTQRYPIGLLGRLYPTTGNFIAVVGNVRSRKLVRQVVAGMRRSAFPCEGMAAPKWLKDIFRSDHAAFWKYGYSALMITDTANFRYPHYHTPRDTPDKINYDRLARVIVALERTVSEIVGLAGQ